MPLALKPEGLVNRLWELDKNVSHEGELVCTVCMVIVHGGGGGDVFSCMMGKLTDNINFFFSGMHAIITCIACI